tara:strand:- start:663 stop:1229 length:567 start_codon:yes stop_codon:yes gene_type:complete
MAVPVSELQKANPSSIIELFILDLIPSIHGNHEVMTHRFHNGSNQNGNNNIIFGGQTYVKMPIAAEGFSYSGKQLPRPKLSISNILGTFTGFLVYLPMGMEGAKVTRRRTLLRYLDHANFSGGSNPYNSGPDSTAVFPDEIYTIDRKAVENREIVEFELAAKIDVMGIRLPKRQVLPNEFPGVGTFYS